MSRWSSPFRIAAAIFLAMFALLFAVHANRAVTTNDEGILLDAAQKVAAGERPYLDFWAYMSPGSYWLQASVFRLFGISMIAGRLIVMLDFSLQCALVFWFTSRLASAGAGVVVTLAFAGFQMADPAFLTAQHRWDSSTFALAGTAVAISTQSKLSWVLSGMLLAAAAWCTPTDAMVGCIVALWIVVDKGRRTALVPFLTGIAAVSLAAAAWLAATGCLAPFIEQMFWLRKNYLVNAMPYGSIIGGYMALFEGSASGMETFLRGVLVTCVALPAILPLAALVGWGILLWRTAVVDRSRVVVLLGAAGALVLALSPRPDVGHLAYVAALPYALAGSSIWRLLPARGKTPLAMAALILAGIFASNSFNTLRATSLVASPIGNLRIENSQHGAWNNLLSSVRPGDSMFVFPYMPMHYFVTQTKNPTEFSFFSPGMSTQREEMAALSELQANPPLWVLYLGFSLSDVLRIVPHGSGAEWKYQALNEWIQKNYLPVEKPEVVVSGYQLRRRVVAEDGHRSLSLVVR